MNFPKHKERKWPYDISTFDHPVCLLRDIARNPETAAYIKLFKLFGYDPRHEFPRLSARYIALGLHKEIKAAVHSFPDPTAEEKKTWDPRLVVRKAEPSV